MIDRIYLHGSDVASTSAVLYLINETPLHGQVTISHEHGIPVAQHPNHPLSSGESYLWDLACSIKGLGDISIDGTLRHISDPRLRAVVLQALGLACGLTVAVAVP
jgi:hypothetical protein